MITVLSCRALRFPSMDWNLLTKDMRRDADKNLQSIRPKLKQCPKEMISQCADYHKP